MSFIRKKSKIALPNSAIVTYETVKKIIEYLWYEKSFEIKNASLQFKDAVQDSKKLLFAHTKVCVQHDNKEWKLDIEMRLEKNEGCWKPLQPIAVHLLDKLPTSMIMDGEVWFTLNHNDTPFVNEPNSIKAVHYFRTLLGT